VTTKDEDKFIRIRSLCDRRLTARNINIKLNQCCDKNLSTSTIHRRLSKATLNWGIALKKLLLMPQNIVKRLQWAKAHKDWTIEQWNKVL
jgi:hypothetical protein